MATDELNITAETVEAALTNETKAIVVRIFLAIPRASTPIIDLARSKNIRVIDDAARKRWAQPSMASHERLGDLGILSFGSEKVCFGLGGGVVVYQRKKISKAA